MLVKYIFDQDTNRSVVAQDNVSEHGDDPISIPSELGFG